MDIRGVEVTNQLRSAIRAKLLELGVRYDEELPDYILVMVVNKKSRQQMHEDLHLFLESNTAPFVDWLHDQVLKKLQKVTVAKKKATREFVPAVIIKQEEQRKKHKTATTFLDDQSTKKLLGKPLKEDKDAENEPTKLESPSENSEAESKQQISKNVTRETELKEHSAKTVVSSTESENVTLKKVDPIEQSSPKAIQSIAKSNKSQPDSGSSKPAIETVNNSEINTSTECEKRSRNIDQEDDLMSSDSKKLKSSINKPRITSVVSIKNRLGIISPKKKSDVHSERDISFNKHKHGEEHQCEPTNRRNNISWPKNSEFGDDSRNSRNFDTKTRDKTIDIKNRLGNLRDNKPNVNLETREKVTSSEKPGSTIKNRLGTSNSNRTPPQSSSKKQDIQEERRIDHRLERNNFRGKNVKYRLGPMRKTFRTNDNRNSFKSSANLKPGKDGNFSNVSFEDDVDEDDEAGINVAPVKSHIVAVLKPSLEKFSRKRSKSNDEVSDAEEEDVADCKVPSKVIVTPRPLKPLPSIQKRATQSLLLRAVAEANQSVVSRKNPEPSLVEAKPPLKRPKPSGSWAGGQNLSVHLDSKKRFVMENIQIELTTVTNKDTKSYESHEVTDEHIGVVRSLFHQSNNDQKFLVTLNGYNNNLPQEKSSDENEENPDPEINECEEQDLSVGDSNPYPENESDLIALRVSNSEEDDKEDNESNNSKESNNDENQNTENINDIEEPPKKPRKLSPIVYNKSRSPSPEISTTKLPISSAAVSIEKKSKIDSVSVSLNSLIDETCRYWPNCTLGKKCAYIHPDVACSLFPACKFGENCQYLHPKCKFGLSCTKVGCIFSHPSGKCKYHPYCTNPSCSFSHPSLVKPTLQLHTNPRDKFTWRRQN